MLTTAKSFFLGTPEHVEKIFCRIPILTFGRPQKASELSQFIYINTAVYVCMGENIFCLWVRNSDLNGDGLFLVVVVFRV